MMSIDETLSNAIASGSFISFSFNGKRYTNVLPLLQRNVGGEFVLTARVEDAVGKPAEREFVVSKISGLRLGRATRAA